MMQRFNGSDYKPERDNRRLSSQLDRIKNLMADGVWRTLSTIASQTNSPQASVSAQLRNLRKPQFGSHKVEKIYEGSGLYWYRLLLSRRTKAA